MSLKYEPASEPLHIYANAKQERANDAEEACEDLRATFTEEVAGLRAAGQEATRALGARCVCKPLSLSHTHTHTSISKGS